MSYGKVGKKYFQYFTILGCIKIPMLISTVENIKKCRILIST